jgi:hypothetical protein
MHQLDTGPTTVTGERPGFVEPIVARIIEKLTPLVDKPEVNLEVEGRLGIITRGRSAGERLELPVLSETILSKRKDFSYEFKADVGKSFFTAIKTHLTAIHKNKVQASHPLFKISHIREIKTIDEIYTVPGTRESVRVSSDGVVINKNRLDIIDVYTGADESIDFRLAINDEQKVSTNFAKDPKNLTGRREKHRTQFDLKGFVIDLTEVQSKDRSGDHVSYEVEVELKSELLLDQVKLKLNNQKHFLYELVTDFLFVLRDLAVSFGTLSSDDKTAQIIKPSDEAVKKYLKLVADFQPIVGDYLYSIADELKPRST